MDRGIRPVTWDWPDRSKWWLFTNGVTLNQSDGTLVVPEQMQEVARDLVTCLLYTSPSPRDGLLSRMPSSA